MIARPAIQPEARVSSVIDTQQQMVPAPPGGDRADGDGTGLGPRIAGVLLMAVGLLALAAVLVASVLPPTLTAENAKGDEAEYALVPADASPVASRLSFAAVERYPAQGEFLFVTIRQPEITLLDWFVGEGQGEISFYSYNDLFGNQSPDERQTANQQLMRSAKETAEYVALSHLGYPVELVPGDVVIDVLVCLEANEAGTECVKHAPSDELLDAGDKLLSLDGVDVHVIDDLAPILRRHQPGDRITVEFERGDQGVQSGEIELIASPDDPARTIVGFIPFDTATANVPFEIVIDSGEIGGPSAGLAFTLSLIDELTPGELTGNREVAVTGTIRLDGSVGAIGGLASKVSAVKQMGAEVFIVPTEQGEDDLALARRIAGDDLKIVAVENLDQALAALADLGGNAAELGKPGEGFGE
jgi:Lon-like protease